MKIQRLLGSAAAVAVVASAALLYNVFPAHGSDHQDSPTMVSRPGADITDVFVFPSPANSANVVLAMDVHPLIAPGAGPTTYFDPQVMYQLKISHAASGVEDQVIQFKATGSGSAGDPQTIAVYGPAAPTTTGVNSTYLPTAAGTVAYNASAALSNGVQVFAGPRADPFYFDLFQFFKIIPDRNQAYHPPTSPTDNVPAGTSGSFNGFTAAYNTANNSSCSTAQASDALSSNKFNVLSLVVEVPKSLLQGASSTIHVYATTSTQSGS